MMYIGIGLVLVIISWILYAGLFFLTDNQKRSIIFTFLPKVLYTLDLDRRYINFVSFIKFLVYTIIGIVLLTIHSDLIDQWFYYINVFLDIFMIVPAIAMYTSVSGMVVMIFYIHLRYKSEYEYNIHKKDRWYIVLTMFEAFFWWGILYHIMDNIYHDYNVVVALGIAFGYTLTSLAQYINILRHKIFPIYMCVHWFLSMFFCCALLTLSENILIPVIFSVTLVYLLMNNWKIVFPKINFSRKNS